MFFKCLKSLSICLTLIMLSSKLIADKPIKIVSLAPAVTQNLIELDCQNTIVGHTAFSPYHSSRPKIIGDAFALRLETIVHLKPDIVIGIQGFNSPKHKDNLKQLGIKTLYLKPFQSWQSIQDNFRQLAAIAKSSIEVEPLLHSYHQTIKAISQRYHNEPSQTIFVQVSQQPLITIGQQSFLNDLWTIFGFTNVFSEIKQNTFPISIESVVTQQPQWIIDVSLQNTLTSLQRFWKPLQTNDAKYIVFDQNYLTLPSPGNFIKSIKMIDQQLLRENRHEKN